VPFLSQAQRRMMFANHPAMAKRWAHETPDIKELPEKVKKAKESAQKLHKKRGG